MSDSRSDVSSIGDQTRGSRIDRQSEEHLLKDEPLVEEFAKLDAINDLFLCKDQGLGACMRRSEMDAPVNHLHDGSGMSLTQFLRNVGPRKLARDLEAALLSEVLRPVYIFRPRLIAHLSCVDENRTGDVSIVAFRSALDALAGEALKLGLPASDAQLRAACEIASGGSDRVLYREFLRSLRGVDLMRFSTTSGDVESGVDSTRAVNHN